MGGYFSRIVERSRPVTPRGDLYTAPVKDVESGDETGMAPARAVRPEQIMGVERLGETLGPANVVEHPGERVERTITEKNTVVERPGGNLEHTNVAAQPGERPERVIREKETVVKRPGEKVERIVKEKETVLERRGEKIERHVMGERPGQRAEHPITQRERGKEARVVVANASPEKPLPPVAAQQQPSLIIGKITVEVMAAPKLPVAAASASRNKRAPRPAAAGRLPMGDGPHKLGFGLGQL